MGPMGRMGPMGHKSESRVMRHQERSRWRRRCSLGGGGSVVGVWSEGFALLFGLRRPRRRTGTAVPCPYHAVLRARVAWGVGV